jgi:hypothetical protein
MMAAGGAAMLWQETCVMDQRIGFIVARRQGEEAWRRSVATSGSAARPATSGGRAIGPGAPPVSRIAHAPQRNPRAIGDDVVEAVMTVRQRHPSWGPLVIVGQARSGTSLLTRVLADTRRFALVNDAHVVQYLDGLARREPLDLHQRSQLVEFLLTQIRNRIVSREGKEMFRSIDLTPRQLCELEWTAKRLMNECESGWDLIEAVLSSTARLSGCDVWGWKFPPDYMHVDRILRRVPQARFIFVIRDPFRMMRSYKNWPRGGKGGPATIR